MTRKIRMGTTIPAPPDEVYEAWVTGRKHAAMTGSAATSQARVGGRFTAWDGYISGKHLELAPGERIVQSWRTTDFPPGSPDSRLEVALGPASGGTRLTLIQSEIPEGQAQGYKQGWKEFYFDPMKRYFGSAKAPKRGGAEK